MTMTTMTTQRTLISLLFFILLATPALAQEKPLKDYAEDRRERKFCLYPSTLRMINLKQDENFNEMVSSIEKLLIYRLDSAARADRSYVDMLKAYREQGYEEYISAYGGGTNMYLYGNENRNPSEFVGIFGDRDMTLAIYIRGMINWGKIPEFIDTIRDDEMLQFFDLNSANFGKDTHDQ